MPSALVICHERYEGLAGFRAPIDARGFAIDEIYVGDPDFRAVDLLDPDLLVIMGGPMGVYEQDRHPWMGHEIVRVAERIAADRPTIGVCLGSQIMAAAMGARVYKGPVNEVGFAPVALNAAGQGSPLAEIAGVPMLHWHGDTFDLPEDVTLLASTPAFAHQAFARGDNILALQFHPEMGEDPGFSEWCAHGTRFAAKAGTTPERLMADYAALGPQAAAAGRRLLDRWLAALDV